MERCELKNEVYVNAITALDAGYAVAVESLSYLVKVAEYIKADAKGLMPPENYEELLKKSSTRALVNLKRTSDETGGKRKAKRVKTNVEKVSEAIEDVIEKAR